MSNSASSAYRSMVASAPPSFQAANTTSRSSTLSCDIACPVSPAVMAVSKTHGRLRQRSRRRQRSALAELPDRPRPWAEVEIHHRLVVADVVGDAALDRGAGRECQLLVPEAA